jgi:FAD synthase
VRVTSLPEAEPRARRVAVGTFDGVHLGHREVIDGADTVLTFDPHPLQVVHPEATPKLLDSFPIKRDLIASRGSRSSWSFPSTGSSPRAVTTSSSRTS